MKWITLYSQTGNEIYNLAVKLNRQPDLILTNNPTTPLSGSNFYKHAELEHILANAVSDNIIITLHGYLRILSPSLCDLPCIILNGHPAPIHLYPELKGKDMQEQLFLQKEKYKLIGTVIHKVIAELDSGDIIAYNSEPNNLQSVEESYIKLKQMSLDLWYNTLKEML